MDDCPGDESALLQTYVEPQASASPFPSLSNWAVHKLGKLQGATASVSPKLVKVSINSQEDLGVLLSAVATITLGVVVVLLLFSLLRRRYPLVYAGRADEILTTIKISLGEGLFDWVRPTLRLSAEDVQKASTLDHAMLVEFCILCMRILFVLGVPLICVVCPLHALAGGGAAGDDRLSWIGFANVQRDSWLCMMHSIVVWAVVYVTMRMVYVFQEKVFLPRRFTWLRTMPTARATTIMVENIPEKHRTDDALKDYFGHVFRGHVRSAWVVKRTRRLTRLLKELRSAQSSLKAEEFQWEKVGRHPDHRPNFLNLHQHSPAPRCPGNHLMRQVQATETGRDTLTCNRCGAPRTAYTSCSDDSTYNLCEDCYMKASRHVPERLDALNYYEEKAKEATAEISAERARILEAARGPNDDVYTSTGFVTFSARRDAMLALQVQYMQDRTKMMASIPPPPGDVLYEDLQANDIEQDSKTVLGWIVIALIFVGFMPVVLCISAFANLHALSVDNAWLRSLRTDTPVLFIILDGILGSLLLMIFIDCMPTLLSIIFYNFFKLKSMNWGQLYLQKVYFWFLLIFVVLVEALGGSLAETVIDVASKPTLLGNILAEALPISTHFYMKYLVIQWLGPVLGLLRIMQLPKFLIYRRIYGDKQAKVMCEPEDQDYYGIGSRSARVAIDMCISIIFSSLSPIIVLVGFINMAMRYLYLKYIVVFAETRKADLGGMFWVTQLEHLQIGLLFYILLQVGVLAERCETRVPSLLTMPAFFIWAVMFREFKRHLTWESLPFEEVAVWEGNAALASARNDTSFEQPELFDHGFPEDAMSSTHSSGGRWLWLERLRDPVVEPLMRAMESWDRDEQ